MTVRVVVACRNAGGTPTFTCVRVECAAAERDEGEHLDAAASWASSQGHDGPFLCFDESDGPAWLFGQFAWETAATILAQDY